MHGTWSIRTNRYRDRPQHKAGTLCRARTKQQHVEGLVFAFGRGILQGASSARFVSCRAIQFAQYAKARSFFCGRAVVSHNVEADFASSELARMLVNDPSLCYGAAAPTGLSATASYEPSGAGWPKADGLVSLLESLGGAQRDIAIEYKRPNEGIHGLLTAIGQAHGYIHKGYSAAAIVIPSFYATHSTPGDYVREVLDRVSTNASIGVFRYDEPDLVSPTPFAGKLQCVRPFTFVTGSGVRPILGRGAKTQWVHMREGSTTRDAFFRFLQTAKWLPGSPAYTPRIPPGLVSAVNRIAPGRNVVSYLANTADTRFLTQVWEAFWFEWIATPDVLTPWVRDAAGVYSVPAATTRILRDDNIGYSQIWQGRVSGLKEKLVAMLNAGTATEDRAWEMFAAGIPGVGGAQRTQGIRERAHSYREDIDSSLAQLEWIDSTGAPTDYGYKYMTICERYGGANSQAAISYMGATLLQTGRYASFLHYVHRLSERTFSADPLAYTEDVTGRPAFTEDSYWEYLADIKSQLTNELHVMRTATGRGRGRVRTEFQAELTLLRNYGFVSASRYRLGLGIPIDWERVHQAMNVEL